MGLDSVELVMSIEDKFGIRIEKSEAEKTLTLNDFVDVVSKKLMIVQTHQGLNQQLFFRFKEALEDLIGCEKQITSEKLVSEFFTISELEKNGGNYN